MKKIRILTKGSKRETMLRMAILLLSVLMFGLIVISRIF